ncbi:MAG: OadG family protein [Clostridia bacterium]|nr:OadG family protein [Clostridia bacterium]
MTAYQWFIVGMGIGVVFIGLISIVLLCKIISALCSIGDNKNKKVSDTEKKIANTATTVNTVQMPIENRQEIIAAVSAAVAEELGTDISAIRILSFKKI